MFHRNGGIGHVYGDSSPSNLLLIPPAQLKVKEMHVENSGQLHKNIHLSSLMYQLVSGISSPREEINEEIKVAPSYAAMPSFISCFTFLYCLIHNSVLNT